MINGNLENSIAYDKDVAGGSTAVQYSPTQTMFLARMQNLVEQRIRYSDLVGPQDWRMRLIKRSLYSTYRDLQDLGLEKEVKNMMERGGNTR